MKDTGLDTIPYLKSFLYQIKSESLEDSKKEKQRRERKKYLRDIFNYSNIISRISFKF